MCLYPKLIPNRKYTPNKKNGGIIPPINDPRVTAVAVGCGNCMECRKQKAREWQVRLQEDIKLHKNATFVTLTLSNQSIQKINKQIPLTFKDKKNKEHPLEGYKRDNAIAKYAVRHFLERWRKKYKKSVRHWLVTELGHQGTENIHLHGFIWTKDIEAIEERWGYGFIWKGYMQNGKIQNYVNDRTINYCIKYVQKVDEDHMYYKSKILCSAGIGNNYIPEIKYKACEQYLDFRINKKGERKWSLRIRNIIIKDGYARGDWYQSKFKGKDTKESYTNRQGAEISMPIYWRNKIYTDDERELLWLQRLDKQERWVCGNKIDISKGVAKYYELLKIHQYRNIKLGYGTDRVNWKREEYEHNRRKFMLEKRIAEKEYTPSAGS